MHMTSNQSHKRQWRYGRLFCLLLCLLLAACKTEVYTDLSQQEANEMIAVLATEGITASRTHVADARYALEVDEDSLTQSIRLLQRHGYPRERFTTMGEVFERQGLLSSPVEERARYIFAVSQSVAETLSRIDGVVTARVNLVMPENNPFEDKATPSSAAVFIKFDPDHDLRDLQPDIKLLVQKSIEGLSYDSITLIMMPAQRQETPPGQPAFQQAADTGSRLPVLGLFLLAGLGFTIMGFQLGRGRRRHRRSSAPDSARTPAAGARGQGMKAAATPARSGLPS